METLEDQGTGGDICCLCRDKEDGIMIACDNSCWFHYAYVCIQRKPKGLWFCPKCEWTQLFIVSCCPEQFCLVDVYLIPSQNLMVHWKGMTDSNRLLKAQQTNGVLLAHNTYDPFNMNPKCAHFLVFSMSRVVSWLLPLQDAGILNSAHILTLYPVCRIHYQQVQ